MSGNRRKWFIALAVFSSLVCVVVAGILVGGSVLRRRFEPFIRQRAISYLSEKFDSRVELASLRIHIPPTSPVHLLFTGGRGTLARVEGAGLTLQQNRALGFPPILKVHHFAFDVDLGAVFDSPATVNRVTVEGMELMIPPKGDRVPLRPRSAGDQTRDNGKGRDVLLEQVLIKNCRLSILPKDKEKTPLIFDIETLQLQSVGKSRSMTYRAVLTNPKPPGLIQSAGDFGPWSTEEPGDTPLRGTYKFEHADLGVFQGIAGILNSTGSFAGTISSINAKGEASVPDFRLQSAGNPVPLSVAFEVLVDGGNGNTILQPVRATLGATHFTTSGGVIRQEGDALRTITLDVDMPDGDLRDILRLATKSKPFMQGRLNLKTRIGIPPLTARVKEKLMLDGNFRVVRGRFLRSEVQNRIDELSRRGQGQPKNEEIDEVVSHMSGRFRMQNETITFQPITFGTPGAEVHLTGNYNIGTDRIDFHGSLALRAHVSQTMTGWKRWALKPVDPFFAKNGAGTFLHIKIDGTSKSPQFGLDRGKRDSGAPENP